VLLKSGGQEKSSPVLHFKFLICPRNKKTRPVKPKAKKNDKRHQLKHPHL
jgi:hypothetical protein